MKRTHLFLLAGVLAIVAAFAVAAVVVRSRLDLDRLLPGLLARLSDLAGVEVRAGSAQLRGLRRVSLGDLELRGPLGGGCLEASASALRLGLRLRPLLRGRVVIDHVELRQPKVRLLETCGGEALRAQPPPPPTSSPRSGSAPATAAGPPLALEIERLVIGDARFEIAPAAGAAPTFVAEGVHVALERIALGGDSLWQEAAGAVTAQRLVTGDIVATAIAADVAVDRGTLLLEPLRFRVPQAALAGELTVELARDPLAYRCALHGDLDLDATLGVGKGGRLGSGKLEFRAHGAGADPADLAGDGSVALPAGALTAQPTIAAIATALGAPELAALAYQPTAARFRVARGRLELAEPLVFQADEYRLLLSRGATLEGALDLGVRVELPRAAVLVEEIPREVLDLLETDDGRVALPLRLVGTLEAPSARLDAGELGRIARRSARREAERRLLQALRGRRGENR